MSALPLRGRGIAPCLPVDPEPRARLARAARRAMPGPADDHVVTVCVGCGDRIWISPAQLRVVIIDEAAPACIRCALSPDVPADTVAYVTEDNYPPREGR